MQRAPSTSAQEHDDAQGGRHEPQQHIDQIDPDGVFHALLVVVTRGDVLVDVDFAEDAEDGGPEDTKQGGKEMVSWVWVV